MYVSEGRKWIIKFKRIYFVTSYHPGRKCEYTVWEIMNKIKIGPTSVNSL